MNEDEKKNKKLKPDQIFGDQDDSILVRSWRGEVDIEYDPKTTSNEKPVFWETASLTLEDQTIVVCLCGNQKRIYSTKHPDYEKVLKNLLERFPDLVQPGSVCTLTRYVDGRT